METPAPGNDAASIAYDQPGKRRARRLWVRRKWKNHTGNQAVLPLRIYRPTHLWEVRAIVQEAEEHRVTVRAVGSHHSFSDAALTTGFLIETNRMCDERVIDSVKAGVDTSHLVKVEAGMRLRELNALLASRELALVNMGGYDEQTVAGVLGTATHGSGVTLGPICDYAESIDLVGSGGRCYRIEPNGGITDPRTFAETHPQWELHQDDEWFHAVQVSMGCFGVLYSVVLRVRDAFWLNEIRFKRPWSEVRAQLADRTAMSEPRHYEVYFNPHPTGKAGDHTCLVTQRWESKKPDKPARGDKSRRQFLTEIGGNIPGFAWVLRQLFTHIPQWTPWLIDFALRGLEDDGYLRESYRVLNIGSANHLPAISSEIAVSVDDAGTHLLAVDRVIDIAARWREEGSVYHTSPVALRFVRGSEASMSMMHGHEITMMIELILFYPTVGGLELLAAYEDALQDLGGRPHWGQVNALGSDRAVLREMYPAFDSWLAVHEVVNASGVFDGPFSKRLGISPTATRS